MCVLCGVGSESGSTGKLGRAWVNAWVGAWVGAWVHGGWYLHIIVTSNESIALNG